MIAGNDPRIATVILVMPFTSGAADENAFPQGILEQAWSNREEITKSWGSGGLKLGSSANENYVPLWPESLEHAEGKEPQNF
jgi:hypothetical protein